MNDINFNKDSLKKAMDAFYGKTNNSSTKTTSQKPMGREGKSNEVTDFLPSAAEAIGHPSLIIEGNKYELKLGRNTVGRKCDPPQATIQIPTADRYMSRVNATIEVGRNLTGNWRVVIASSNANNLVKVSGRELQMGDMVFLQHGNIVTLGHTDIVFSFC